MQGIVAQIKGNNAVNKVVQSVVSDLVGSGSYVAAGSGCPVRPGNKVCGGYLRNPVELGRD